jgi:hypothetical protein
MTAVEMTVALSAVEERPDSWLGTATLRDESYAHLEVVFEYLVSGALEEIVLHTFRLEPTSEAIAAGDVFRLSPGVIRDLPLARWDRSAQAGVRRAVHGFFAEGWDSAPDIVTPDGVFEVKRTAYAHGHRATGVDSSPEGRRQRAERAVAVLRPDIDPNSSKGSLRTWNSLLRYAEIYEEYGELLLKGERDPIGVIAKNHQVEKPTVRSWLHRAREAGVPEAMMGVLQTPSPLGRELTPEGMEALRELGRDLRAARLASGLELEDLLARMKVSPRQGEVIIEMEKGNFIPAEEQEASREWESSVNLVHSYIRTYARAVGLDPHDQAARYEAAYELPQKRRRWRRK